MNQIVENLTTTKQPYRYIDQHRMMFWIVGMIGGLLIQLIIGSFYMWGIVNIYITSYFRTIDSSVSLEGNAIIFPIIMLMIGPTLRLGIYLSEVTHPILVLGINQTLLAFLVFISSYSNSMFLFIVLYGFLFGLLSGVSYMIPLIQCNKLMPGRKLINNGTILIGTGMGSLIFGLFSYSFLNPDKLSPINGYYAGTQQLVDIALKVPQLLKYLALLYIIIGLVGVLLLAPVVMDNRRRIQQEAERLAHHLHFDIEERHLNHKEAQSVCVGVKSFVFWTEVLIAVLLSCGPFLINGNYKTYVKNAINDDYFLTIVGAIGSLANGCSRFFWSLFFLKTGYKTVILTVVAIQILVFSTIRFTITYKAIFLVQVLLANACIGATFSVAPSFSQLVFGQRTGSNIYGFIFFAISTANFIQFGYVKGLAPLITFNGIIYVCLGMSVLIIPIIYFSTFKGPWENSTINVEYCVNRQLAQYNMFQGQKIAALPYSANRLINIMISDQQQLQKNAPLPILSNQFQKQQKQKQQKQKQLKVLLDRQLLKLFQANVFQPNPEIEESEKKQKMIQQETIKKNETQDINKDQNQ